MRNSGATQMSLIIVVVRIIEVFMFIYIRFMDNLTIGTYLPTLKGNYLP